MNTSEVIVIGRDLLMTGLLLSLPAVLVSLIVGGTISIFQTVTSIQEQTLTFAPRIMAVALILMLTLPWILKVATAFVQRMFLHMLNAV
ncbi:MAG: flagellar biosynthetic protein FliQ [Planctomycetaceae bacterium]|nr:flagellar biosynthetic protein FliQ [Planctomycetaceae bacterium]